MNAKPRLPQKSLEQVERLPGALWSRLYDRLLLSDPALRLFFAYDGPNSDRVRIGDKPGGDSKAIEFVMFDIAKIWLACAVVVPFNAALAQSSVVRFDGIGAVRVGMSLPELNRALHTFNSKPSDPEERSCYYIDVPNQQAVGVMMLDGRVARVDVDNSVTATAEGVHNGDSEARAIKVYGKRLRIEPHAYIPESGHFLTLFSPDRKYGIRFETEDGKITRYYAGTVRAIAFIEGCS